MKQESLASEAFCDLSTVSLPYARAEAQEGPHHLWGPGSASTPVTQTDFPLCSGTCRLLPLVTQFSDVRPPRKPSDRRLGEFISRGTGTP